MVADARGRPAEVALEVAVHEEAFRQGAQLRVRDEVGFLDGVAVRHLLDKPPAHRAPLGRCALRSADFASRLTSGLAHHFTVHCSAVLGISNLTAENAERRGASKELCS